MSPMFGRRKKCRFSSQEYFNITEKEERVLNNNVHTHQPTTPFMIFIVIVIKSDVLVIMWTQTVPPENLSLFGELWWVFQCVEKKMKENGRVIYCSIGYRVKSRKKRE